MCVCVCVCVYGLAEGQLPVTAAIPTEHIMLHCLIALLQGLVWEGSGSDTLLAGAGGAGRHCFRKRRPETLPVLHRYCNIVC